MQRVRQIRRILLDLNLERTDLMARAVEEEGVGLAGLETEQEDAARRAHDRIDDVWTGDQNVARIAVELNDDGLVQAQADTLRKGAAMRRDIDDARRLFRHLCGRGAGGAAEKAQRGERKPQNYFAHGLIPLSVDATLDAEANDLDAVGG